MFPDSTQRGNAELGDNNQIAVALVLYLSGRENKRREKVVGWWVNSLRLKRVQCIISRLQIRVYTD